MNARLHMMLSAAALLLCTAAVAAPPGILFDFEDQTMSTTRMSGDYDTLTATQGGLTLTLGRQNQERFDVWDLSRDNFLGCPNEWGHRSLCPNYNAHANLFVANFSQGLDAAQIAYGDIADDLDYVSMDAYSGLNGTGTRLGRITGVTSEDPYFSDGEYWTLSLDSLGGARSLVFGGGSDAFQQSVYWDNLRVTPVPEPAFYQMGGLLMLGGLGALRLRKRA